MFYVGIIDIGINNVKHQRTVLILFRFLLHMQISYWTFRYLHVRSLRAMQVHDLPITGLKLPLEC